MKGVVNQLMKRVTPTGGDFSCEFAGKWPKHSGFSGFLLNWPNIFRVEGLGVPGWATVIQVVQVIFCIRHFFGFSLG